MEWSQSWRDKINHILTSSNYARQSFFPLPVLSDLPFLDCVPQLCQLYPHLQSFKFKLLLNHQFFCVDSARMILNKQIPRPADPQFEVRLVLDWELEFFVVGGSIVQRKPEGYRCETDEFLKEQSYVDV